MFSINPIYAMIAGVALAIGAAGTIKYQSDKIHSQHLELNCVEHGDCPKGYEKLVTVPQLQTEIRHMMDVQTHQTTKTEKNIPAVKPSPEVVTKIKEIKVPVKIAADCPTPEIPQELEEILP